MFWVPVARPMNKLLAPLIFKFPAPTPTRVLSEPGAAVDGDVAT